MIEETIEGESDAMTEEAKDAVAKEEMTEEAREETIEGHSKCLA